jgi:hypothetical protein
MSFSQPNLFGDTQPDLFGKDPKPAAYRVNPQHIRYRFIEFLEKMQAAETWPWDGDHVETLRGRTWPYLFAKLPDAAEAAEWKAKLEVEAARLDAAAER